MNLELVPINDLVDEISNRTDSFVMAYTRKIDVGDPVVVTSHKCGSWLKGIGLAEVIKDDLLEKFCRGKDKEVD